MCGAVKEPKSFWAPVGTPFRDLLALAGGATVADFGIFVSGLMMGTLTFDLDDVVTKTTGGLIVLPRDHYLMTRQDALAAGDEPHRQIGLRPVQLLHGVLPALPAGLRSAAAQSDAQPGLHHDRRRHLEPVVGAVLRLRPVHAVRVSRRSVSQGGLRPGQAGPARGRAEVRAAEAGGGAPHEGVPARAAGATAAAFAGGRVRAGDAVRGRANAQPAVVRIKMKQHAGEAAAPAVQEGQKVKKGQVVGRVADGKLGAHVHASIDGKVRTVTPEFVEIVA